MKRCAPTHKTEHEAMLQYDMKCRVRVHPKYGKIVKKTRKHHAQDESSEGKMGDTVRIMETKLISKTKRWRVTEVIERAR